MGNRANRSTELAIRLLTSQVEEAWKLGASASLLQLDIKGYFDSISHARLIDTVERLGLPSWLLSWLESYLQDRTTTLYFDGAHSPYIGVQEGVPRGSPLSPILAILFLAPLYRELREAHPGVSVVGFADDTNLLAFGKSAAFNTNQLEAAWRTCLGWANRNGISFAPDKCELLHFNRHRKPWKQGVRLDEGLLVTPVTEARFLGVWLDRKLRWGTHYKVLRKKLESQSLALSRIAGKTWGPGLIQARLVYTQVIRSALAYGASAFHTPTKKGGRPGG